MRRSLVSLLCNGLPQRALPTALQATAPSPLARSFATKQSGLAGVTVTKGSAAVQQAAQQQRWVVGDADSFKKCDPCEQGGKPLDRSSALALLQQTPDWTLSEDGASISRSWQAKVTRLLDCSRARVSGALLLTRACRISRAAPPSCSAWPCWRRTRGISRIYTSCRTTM